MATLEIANGLVQLVKEGKFEDAYKQYYSPDIVSVEAGGQDPESRGMEAVNAKVQWWDNTYAVNGLEVIGPYVNGNQFAVHYKMDITEKATGTRSEMNEVAIYTVEGDKIVHERFFYNEV